MPSKFVDLLLPGAELYVPDARDRFTVVSGGMPNGDPSLRIGQGNNDGNYTARIGHSSPNATPFTSTSNSIGTLQAISFWIKPHPTRPFLVPAGVTPSPLFSVMLNSHLGPDFYYANGVSGAIHSADAMAWAIYPVTVASQVHLRISEHTNGSSTSADSGPLVAGEWNMIVFNRTTLTTSRPRWAGWRQASIGRVQGTSYPPGINTVVSHGTANANRFFYIGTPEASGGPGLRLTSGAGDTDGFEIGKLAFRYGADVGYTPAQMDEMWESMISGPPSP